MLTINDFCAVRLKKYCENNKYANENTDKFLCTYLSIKNRARELKC